MLTKWAVPSLKSFADITTERAALGRLTTFGVGGPADILIEPRSIDELSGVMAALNDAALPWRILGGGSNLLVSDDGVRGAVIRLRGDFAGLEFDGARVTAGAAVPLARLVDECAKKGLSGVEGLVGIPGTVGGALVMNAGGRWARIGNVVESVSVLAKSASGGVRLLGRCDAGFAYRHSALGNEVILGATLALCPVDAATVAETMRGYLDQKRQTQDLGARSAGCAFKNPADGPSAGALIDRAGLKEACIGGAKVSSVHANFIINAGSATARDVSALIRLIQAKVLEHSGVSLELEVQLW